MESDGDHFLAYYLTREDAPAELFKDSRFLDDSKNPVRPHFVIFQPWRLSHAECH